MSGRATASMCQSGTVCTAAAFFRRGNRFSSSLFSPRASPRRTPRTVFLLRVMNAKRRTTHQEKLKFSLLEPRLLAPSLPCNFFLESNCDTWMPCIAISCHYLPASRWGTVARPLPSVPPPDGLIRAPPLPTPFFHFAPRGASDVRV